MDIIVCGPGIRNLVVANFATDYGFLMMRELRALLISLIILCSCTAQQPSQPVYSENYAKYELCARGVFEYWERKGLTDYGDASAYIGAGGANQKAQILEDCGHRPTIRSQRGTALTPKDCNDSYVQVYLNCLSKPDFLQTNLARSYIESLDSHVFDEARLASLCQGSERIDRQSYGILMCGE